MNKLVAVGVMAIALVLIVSVCGCVQQTSTPSNQTGNVREKISNATERISNVTTRISNLTQNGSIGPINVGSLNLTAGGS
ncbi:MAG: hypothetical protein ACXVIG_02830 [Halobacteriota archaeon]